MITEVKKEKQASRILPILVGIGFLLLLLSNAATIYYLLSAKDEIRDRDLLISKNQGQIELFETTGEKLAQVKSENEKLIEENKILSGRINDLETDISLLLQETTFTETEIPIAKSPPAASEPVYNNPTGAFTSGSSEDHVRTVMGSPDSVIGNVSTYTWWYGKQSFVTFDKASKSVESWYDGAGNLKTK